MSHPDKIHLRLLSSMATRELLQTLASDYQRTRPVQVAAEADGGVKVASRVRAGEPLDVVVLARAAIDELLAEGCLLAGSCVDVVRSGIAVAVPSGAGLPDVSTASALRQAVLDAASIAWSTGPSGKHLERTFEGWGIMDSIRGRLTVAPAGLPVASLLAAGSVQLGFQQFSELLGVAGVTILGPLPPEVQVITTFSGALSSSTRHRDEAAGLLRFLASPIHAEIRRRLGMEP